LLMRQIGVVHVGRSAFVRRDALEEYLAKHGGIEVRWPVRKPGPSTTSKRLHASDSRQLASADNRGGGKHERR
jgi:hypothetical protein